MIKWGDTQPPLKLEFTQYIVDAIIIIIIIFIEIDQYRPLRVYKKEVGAFLSWDTFKPNS